MTSAYIIASCTINEQMLSCLLSQNLPKKGQTFKGRPPLWTMDRLMTARQLFAVYGINECDLPKGSRAKRNSFSAQITMHYQKLHRLVHVNDWSTGKVEIV